MFVLDDLLMMAALGAGGGALFNKDDPLKGALLGAGLGAAGGAIAPGLLGAGGATAGIAPGTQAGMLAAQEAGLGASSLGWGGATTGVQGGINGLLGAETGANAGGMLSTIDKYSKPVNSIMDAAQKGQQMAAANEPQQMPAPTLQHTPPDLNGLLQQGMQMQQSTYDEAEARRKLMQLFAQQMGA